MGGKSSVWLEEYLSCWNATEAARRAGYRWPNKQGPRNLKRFAQQISDRIAEKAMTADEVLLRLAEIGRGAHSEYINGNGKVNVAAMVEDGRAHLIKGIKSKKFGKDIEFYDMQCALVQLGKYHGLFTDKVEHSGQVTIVGVDPDGDGT